LGKLKRLAVLAVAADFGFGSNNTTSAKQTVPSSFMLGKAKFQDSAFFRRKETLNSVGPYLLVTYPT